MNPKLLKELIDQVALFESETKRSDLPSFLSWLQSRQSTFTLKPVDLDMATVENQIAYGLIVLNQHARHYIKRP